MQAQLKLFRLVQWNGIVRKGEEANRPVNLLVEYHTGESQAGFMQRECGVF